MQTAIHQPDSRYAVFRLMVALLIMTVGSSSMYIVSVVLPAVQAVVSRGFVDENAIGIQGHSWGGYQIAYMITRTNRFRAAAAGAPVVDMVSSYDAIRWGPGIPRQFQYERTQSRIGGTVWQYPLRYIENSPIFAFSPVNRIRGQQAKPSCMLRHTWLATSNSVDFCSP